MSGTGLYIAATGAGAGAYMVGRAVLHFRDFHRSAIRSERNVNVLRLLQPYDRASSADGPLYYEAPDGSRRGPHLHAVGTEREAG